MAVLAGAREFNGPGVPVRGPLVGRGFRPFPTLDERYVVGGTDGVREVYDRAQAAFGGPAYDTTLSVSGLLAIKDTILGGVNDDGARDAYNAVFGLVVSAYGWAYDSALGRAALDALKDDALAWVADQGGIRVESRTPVSGGAFTVTLSKAGGVLVAFQPTSGGQLTFVTSETASLTHAITLPLLKAGTYRVIPLAFETPLTEGA